MASLFCCFIKNITVFVHFFFNCAPSFYSFPLFSLYICFQFLSCTFLANLTTQFVPFLPASTLQTSFFSRFMLSLLSLSNIEDHYGLLSSIPFFICNRFFCSKQANTLLCVLLSGSIMSFTFSLSFILEMMNLR